MKDLPCPVCNIGSFESGRAIRVRHTIIGINDVVSYAVECSCGVRGPDADTKEEAIEKWNAMPRKYNEIDSLIFAYSALMGVSPGYLRKIVGMMADYRRPTTDRVKAVFEAMSK